jgi:hypothetical protein
MTTLYDEITNPLAQVMTDVFDAPVDAILSADVDKDGVIYGQVLSSGNVYDYEADNYAIELDYSPKDTASLNYYSQAILDSIGIRIDSSSAYDSFEYARGVLRMDVGQMKCKSGNIPCGRKCLPKGQKCRKGMGAAGAVKVGQTRAGLRMPGGGGILAKAALMTAAGGAIAGGVTLANSKEGKEAIAQGKQAVDKAGKRLARGANVVAERTKRAAGAAGEGLKAANQIGRFALETEADYRSGKMTKEERDQRMQRAGELGKSIGNEVRGEVGENLGKAGQAVSRTLGVERAKKAVAEGARQTEAAVTKAGRTADVMVRRAAGRNARKQVKQVDREAAEREAKAARTADVKARRAAGREARKAAKSK